MSTEKVEVYNRTDGPLVIDDEGHIIPGLTHAEVPETEQVLLLINSKDLRRMEKRADEPEDTVADEPASGKAESSKQTPRPSGAKK